MEQIKIKDLTFFYNKQEKPAIENLSFNIEKGDFVVLCGKSGCGKSTLLRCLKPIIKPYGKTLGDIIFENEKLEKLSERQQAEKIGFVMQNPEHQIVTDKVWHELAFGLESLGYSTDEIQLRVTEMAEYFGITDLYYNSVNQLSGGQKQLLNLAATMVMGPEILILDEPTAQLDPIAAENFLGTLKKINDELGITVILSEHRLDNVLAYGNKVIVMDSGKIQYCGEPYKILEHNIDEDVLKLMPMATRIYYESGMEGADEKTPISISDGRRWLERLVKNGSKNVEDIEKGLDKEINENTKRNISEDINKKVIVKNDYAIKCKNVWFRYEKASPDIIKGLNFEIKKGEIFAILGGNGTGIPVYRQLQKEGIPFAAGILWENDREYSVAEALASVVIWEKAFEPVSDTTFETAVKVLKNCEKVICCMENFGTYQEPCRQLWKIAKDLGKI